MSQFPDPYRTWPPPGPPENEGGRPPLPPRPNPLPPDSSYFARPEMRNPPPNSYNQPYYTSGDNSYGASRQYIPPGQATPFATAPADNSNTRFSLRSTLGQIAKTALFGHAGQAGNAGPALFGHAGQTGNAGPAPFMPSGASSVVVNGSTLTQADLMGLQTLVGPVLPGSYWYDRRCGAFGYVGGPCRGFITAGLGLGGRQLAPNASGNTGTRVFINGREIHAMDVMSLQAMGVAVMPGNWWVNADGSYGFQGNPIPLGNLRLQAWASGGGGGGGGGGAHTWTTGMGNYGGTDGQGFMYVGGPGWSWSN